MSYMHQGQLSLAAYKGRGNEEDIANIPSAYFILELYQINL